MSKLEAVPNLMELVKNPFMPTVALRTLPSIVKGTTDLASIKVSRLSLYQSFFDEWSRLGRLRLLSMKMEGEMLEIREGLLEDGFSDAVFDFLKDLSAAIYWEQDGNPTVQFNLRRDSGTWKARYFGLRPELTFLRESSPLTRAGVQYRFIHTSLLEYLFARHVYDSSPNLTFCSHALTQMNLVKKPEVVMFLAEYAQGDHDFKQRLLQFIEQSKVDVLASQAAANAITTLVKADVGFKGEDLRRIRIPGADLSEEAFDTARLQEADLTGCNLSQTWLRDADLSGACLRDVRLGEAMSTGCKEIEETPEGKKTHELYASLEFPNRGLRLSGTIFDNAVGLCGFNKLLLEHRHERYMWKAGFKVTGLEGSYLRRIWLGQK